MAAISRRRVEGEGPPRLAAPPGLRALPGSRLHKRSYSGTSRGRRRNEAAHNVLWCGGPCSSSVSRRGARDPWAAFPGGPSREAKVGGVFCGAVLRRGTYLLAPLPPPSLSLPSRSFTSCCFSCISCHTLPHPPCPPLALSLIYPSLLPASPSSPVQRLQNY